MTNLLFKLIKLANELDTNGEFKTADDIDKIILFAGDRTAAVDEFIQKLKKMFILVAQNPNVPSINENNLDIIFAVIDTLSDKGTFLNPSTESESIKNFDDDVVKTVEEMKELERSVKQLKVDLQQQHNAIDLRKINSELERDDKKLRALKEKVRIWQLGQRKGDSEKYKRFEQLWNK